MKAALRRGLVAIEKGIPVYELVPEKQLALFQEYQSLWWKLIGARRHEQRKLKRQLKWTWT